jgi:hypothetical protein
MTPEERLIEDVKWTLLMYDKARADDKDEPVGVKEYLFAQAVADLRKALADAEGVAE